MCYRGWETTNGFQWVFSCIKNKSSEVNMLDYRLPRDLNVCDGQCIRTNFLGKLCISIASCKSIPASSSLWWMCAAWSCSIVCVLGIATIPYAWWSAVRIPVGARDFRFFQTVQTSHAANLPSAHWLLEFLPVSDNNMELIEVKNEWSYTCTHAIGTCLTLNL
jgi:hypothetical protein